MLDNPLPMNHRHIHAKNPTSSASRIALEESDRRKRRGGLTNTIMSPAAAQMNTHGHLSHRASSSCWLLSVVQIILCMSDLILSKKRQISPIETTMSSTLGQMSRRLQTFLLVAKVCLSPSKADSVYAGETNPAANPVRNAKAQRRSIIKTMKRAGRKRGRRGTTVPNNVLIAPVEAAIVVAVVVS